ncbi:hypothetical protein Ciccas_002667 [Cichlidogyrus casuarinus]|uniref:Uncharacterized protein n=1 Tax=Cichlidogyrus casuarinus TaxID=1844966 RepID=A0ABD2QGL7_9PLAT
MDAFDSSDVSSTGSETYSQIRDYKHLIPIIKQRALQKTSKFVTAAIELSAKSFNNVMISSIPEPTWISKIAYLNHFVEKQDPGGKTLDSHLKQFLQCTESMSTFTDLYDGEPVFMDIFNLSMSLSVYQRQQSALTWILAGDNARTLNTAISLCFSINCPMAALESIYLTSKLCRLYHFNARPGLEFSILKAVELFIFCNKGKTENLEPITPYSHGFNTGIMIDCLSMGLVDWIWNVPSASLIVLLVRLSALHATCVAKLELLQLVNVIIDNLNTLEDQAVTLSSGKQSKWYKSARWTKMPMKIVHLLWPSLNDDFPSVSSLARAIIYKSCQFQAIPNLPKFADESEIDMIKHLKITDIQKQIARSAQFKQEKIFSIGTFKDATETSDSDSADDSISSALEKMMPGIL